MSELGSVHEWTDLAMKQERGEDNCIPRFYMREVPDPKESEIAGRPKFKLVPYVEIIIPGSKLDRPDRKVTEADKQRWPAAWAKFQMRQEETLGEGTPIEAWPYLNRAQVAEMKALGILTVEALANLGDSGLAKIGMGARELQQRARQFLKPQDDRETELRAQIKAQAERIKELETERDYYRKIAEAKPKRGRQKDDDA
jgi:hypothetical protein